MKKLNKPSTVKSSVIQSVLSKTNSVSLEQTRIKMGIAAAIEDQLIKKNWSKSVFAEKIGKHPSEISKWMSGTHNFTIDILVEISGALEIKLLELLHLEMQPLTYKQYLTISAESNVNYIKKASNRFKKITGSTTKKIKNTFILNANQDGQNE